MEKILNFITLAFLVVTVVLAIVILVKVNKGVEHYISKDLSERKLTKQSKKIAPLIRKVKTTTSSPQIVRKADDTDKITVGINPSKNIYQGRVYLNKNDVGFSFVKPEIQNAVGEYLIMDANKNWGWRANQYIGNNTTGHDITQGTVNDPITMSTELS